MIIYNWWSIVDNWWLIIDDWWLMIDDWWLMIDYRWYIIFAGPRDNIPGGWGVWWLGEGGGWHQVNMWRCWSWWAASLSWPWWWWWCSDDDECVSKGKDGHYHGNGNGDQIWQWQWLMVMPDRAPPRWILKIVFYKFQSQVDFEYVFFL